MMLPATGSLELSMLLLHAPGMLNKVIFGWWAGGGGGMKPLGNKNASISRPFLSLSNFPILFGTLDQKLCEALLGDNWAMPPNPHLRQEVRAVLNHSNSTGTRGIPEILAPSRVLNAGQ